MQDIRWGIIGCGDVCEIKSGPGFQQVEGSQLVAVMRQNAALAEDFARRHKVPCWYNSAHDLVNDPNVDAVYIATPPRYHCEYTLLVAAAGKPVYVEKPMAMNYNECNTMISACQKSNIPLFVAYYRRALPRFLKIKQLLDSNMIGEIEQVETIYQCPPKPEDTLIPMPWRLNPEISPGGYFGDLAPHTIDILQFLVGDITNCWGRSWNEAKLYPAVDNVTAQFQFENGISGKGRWNFNAASKIDRTIIAGTAGQLEFSIFGESPIELTTSYRTDQFTITNPITIQQPLIQSIVDELQGQGTCPSSGQTAARTNWMMDRILMYQYKMGAS